MVILTRLVYSSLSEVAKMNGAQDLLVKQCTSAEQLDDAVQRAVASVKLIRQKALPSALRNLITLRPL